MPIRLRTSRDPEGRAVLSVADNGVGIDPSDIGSIFDPFFTTKFATQGNGLGLSICYAIVKRAGGDIRVSSTPGKGTKVEVSASVFMNVLIVDDEPGLRSGLAKLLALQGYNTLEATSAAEVRKLLLTTEIHLILLDLRLGEQDGLALLREVKAEEPAIPVIIITGHGDIYSAVECMKAGATNYIPKPIDHGLLLSIIEKEGVRPSRPAGDGRLSRVAALGGAHAACPQHLRGDEGDRADRGEGEGLRRPRAAARGDGHGQGSHRQDHPLHGRLLATAPSSV